MELALIIAGIFVITGMILMLACIIMALLTGWDYAGFYIGAILTLIGMNAMLLIGVMGIISASCGL